MQIKGLVPLGMVQYWYIGIHDHLKYGNRLIADFFTEKRWFYQVTKRW
jgi:hypothetical protein